jgi:hypothetical protein
MGLRRLRDFFARLRDHLTDHAGGRNERVLGLSALDEFIAQIGERAGALLNVCATIGFAAATSLIAR